MSLPHQGTVRKDSTLTTIPRLRPIYNEGRYIRSQTVLQGLSVRKITEKLGVSRSSVHCVIYGRRRSRRIEAEIARILGKSDWNEVVLEARSFIQKKPVAVIVKEMKQAREARNARARESLSSRINSRIGEIEVVDLRQKRRGA